MSDGLSPNFAAFFLSHNSRRDKYLSVLFSQFSERIVRAWCALPTSPYEDLGRPTLWDAAMTSRKTIDFTLRERASGRTFVSELKCELEYDRYRYLTLMASQQLVHHTNEAFQRFLAVAQDPTAYIVRVSAKPIVVDGAILVWGAVSDSGRIEVMQDYGFADVLSVESMLADLHRWRPDAWTELVRDYRSWTEELFNFLEGASALNGGQNS